MQEALTIRSITVDDRETLRSLSIQTFSETFADQNTVQNMAHYLATAFSPEKIAIELQDPNALFFFAVWNDEPIGYLKVNLNHHPDGTFDADCMEIERMYVFKSFHGKGVAQALFNKALSLADDNQKGCIWLGVWEHNPRAIAFYTKYGFAPFGSHPFMLGDDRQTDILMERRQ
jgi:GNAT superfamily N-acetyltransferase